VPAVAGFVLAALYAVFLLVEGLASWAGGAPLLMSAYWLLWPAAALVVSALAWVQVRRSDGTRAGGRLAVWGMLLSGFFGLGYGAYHAAAYLVMQQQAEALADRWINQIRDGQLDEAFLLTLPPGQRPAGEGAGLHRVLEERFNMGMDGGPHGDLAMFAENPIVRLLNHDGTREAGAETQVRSTGVRAWESREEGYRVQLAYLVTTPEREAEVQITLRADKDKQEGREWVVLFKESKPLRDVRITPLGKRVSALRASSRQFVEAWTARLGAGQLGEAYLDTQAPSRRDELLREHVARLALAVSAAALDPYAAAPLADAELGRRLYLPGYGDFLEGSLVHVAPHAFWDEEPLAQEVPKDVKQLFARPDQVGPRAMNLAEVKITPWRRDGNQVRLRHGFQIIAGKRSRFVAGDVIVATDARALEEDVPRPVWQVVSLELHHGRTMRFMPPGLAQPAAPAQPPEHP
jgi:hypothetical protein